MIRLPHASVVCCMYSAYVIIYVPSRFKFLLKIIKSRIP